jgi:hypothetical protein
MAISGVQTTRGRTTGAVTLRGSPPHAARRYSWRRPPRRSRRSTRRYVRGVPSAGSHGRRCPRRWVRSSLLVVLAELVQHPRQMFAAEDSVGDRAPRGVLSPPIFPRMNSPEPGRQADDFDTFAAEDLVEGATGQPDGVAGTTKKSVARIGVLADELAPAALAAPSAPAAGHCGAALGGRSDGSSDDPASATHPRVVYERGR